MRALGRTSACLMAQTRRAQGMVTHLLGRQQIKSASVVREAASYRGCTCDIGGARFATNSAGVRRSVQKKIRKRRALRIRQAVEYASQFDPRMVTTQGLRQTFKKVGWSVQEDHEISEGVKMPFVLSDKYLAFEVAVEEDFYPSTKVLKKDILEKHAQARRKGWKVAVVDHAEWIQACAPPHQHVGRHMYLVELLAKQLPLEDRR